MKYLIVLAVVLVGVWLWRSSRRADLRDKPPAQPRARSLPEPTEIVACAVCAVHLPRTDALTGGQGVYCSDAHRREAEG